MTAQFSIGIIRRFGIEKEEAQDSTRAREEITAYLQNHSIPVSQIPDEQLETPERLVSSGVRVLISPLQRWFNEKYYNDLIRYAEIGGIVLAIYPSFWKDESGNTVIRRRLIDTFGIDEVYDRNIEGVIKFQSSIERWLFEGLPGSITAKIYGWVIIHSSAIPEGEWKISNAYRWESEENPSVADESLTGQSSILCMIKKWPTGGMFIYLNFHFGQLMNKDPRISRILENIAKMVSGSDMQYPSKASKEKLLYDKQIRTYQIIIAIMGVVIGLLLSRYFFSGTDFMDIFKSVVTAILTGLITFFLTNVLGKPQKE